MILVVDFDNSQWMKHEYDVGGPMDTTMFESNMTPINNHLTVFQTPPAPARVLQTKPLNTQGARTRLWQNDGSDNVI